MRILTHPTVPVARFEIPNYDMITNASGIDDFLALLKSPIHVSLREDTLRANQITGANWQPASPFAPFTTLSLTFSSTGARDAYLRGKTVLDPSIEQKLQEFFNERDRAAGKSH